jgi:hypothetical protein
MKADCTEIKVSKKPQEAISWGFYFKEVISVLQLTLHHVIQHQTLK